MLKRYFKAFGATLLCFSGGITGGVVVANESSDNVVDPYDGFYTFSLNLHRIQNEYIEPVETKDLIFHALSGMVNALDEHSAYFPPEEYQTLQEKTGQWSVGAGLEVNNERIITKIVPHGPASIAGLMVGDQLTKINGRSLADWTAGNIHAAFKKEKGSQIAIEILRDITRVNTTVVLDDVPVVNYSFQPIEPGYAYLSIKRFSGGLTTDILAALQLHARTVAPIQGLILDLRNNPGGNVLEGIQLVDAFLKEGPISRLEYRNSQQNQRYNATGQDSDLLGLELVVLINEQSASASELVAGALQEQKRATIVGTKSFGKGSVQKLYTSETEALKLTVGRFTAGTQHISKKQPVTPDIEVHSNMTSPKDALFKEIDQANLSSAQKQIMKQHLAKLSSPDKLTPIPWHHDFETRRALDPVLAEAWQVLVP